MAAGTRGRRDPARGLLARPTLRWSGARPRHRLPRRRRAVSLAAWQALRAPGRLMAGPTSASGRPPFVGLARMVRFNLPQYVLGGTALIAGISVAAVPSLPVVIRLAGAIGGGLAGWWTIASLIAGHVVYDRSDLYGGRWLTELLPEAPGRWANVTAGYDESSLPLRARLRGTGTTIDLYDPGLMGEPSIRRAHAVCPPPGDALRASPDHLPLGDRELDAAFVVFAAHELRNAGDREALFGELARVVRPAGRIV